VERRRTSEIVAMSHMRAVLSFCGFGYEGVEK